MFVACCKCSGPRGDVRGADNITLSRVHPSPSPSAPPKSSFVRCVLYAIRTILRVLPAIGRSSDHVNAPAGLGFKHFAIAGLLCAVMLVSTLVGVVSLVVRLVR